MFIVENQLKLIITYFWKNPQNLLFLAPPEKLCFSHNNMTEDLTYLLKNKST